jgi:hypothetical protein
MRKFLLATVAVVALATPAIADEKFATHCDIMAGAIWSNIKSNQFLLGLVVKHDLDDPDHPEWKANFCSLSKKLYFGYKGFAANLKEKGCTWNTYNELKSHTDQL